MRVSTTLLPPAALVLWCHDRGGGVLPHLGTAISLPPDFIETSSPACCSLSSSKVYAALAIRTHCYDKITDPFSLGDNHCGSYGSLALSFVNGVFFFASS